MEAPDYAGEHMQVEQTNLWDNVTKNLQKDTNKGKKSNSKSSKQK